MSSLPDTTDSPFLTGDPYDTRVERTFGFIDLSGFTQFTDEHGDAEAVRLLARFRTAVREVAAQRGVRVAKWLGDGAMLVSVERELLVEAIVAIQDLLGDCVLPLPLRAGIASGPVILFEGDDYIGMAVNLAARLADLAGPGEVLAHAEVMSSLMVNTSAEPIGRRSLPGIAEPLEVVRLISSDA